MNSGLQTLILSNQYYLGKLTGKLNYPKTLLLKVTSNTFNNSTKDIYILDKSQTSFNLTDTRFLTFLFQNNSLGSKQIYYNQLSFDLHKVYDNSFLLSPLKSNGSLLGTKRFYPTNSIVEQTFTQDLILYLLLLNR
jgi:hypothetical protein